MAGAYTAKPALVSVPDVPPGWGSNWPRPGETDITWPGIDPDPFFPAPFPPGYSSDYSIVTTATASIAPTGTASVTSTVRDHDDYATNEPSAITWAATIDGEAIDLKFDGEEFAPSIKEDPAWGTYWGTTPDIIFDLDDGNLGDTVVLQASCTLSGEALIDTSEIEIAPQVWTYTFSVARGAGEASGDQVISRIRVNGTTACQIVHTQGGTPEYTTSTGAGWSGNFTYALANPQIITATDQDVPLSEVHAWIRKGFQTGAFTVTGTFKTYLNDVLQGTHTISASHGTMGNKDWLTFNYETGEVTIL